jgi:hypothetical protein
MNIFFTFLHVKSKRALIFKNIVPTKLWMSLEASGQNEDYSGLYVNNDNEFIIIFSSSFFKAVNPVILNKGSS